MPSVKKPREKFRADLSSITKESEYAKILKKIANPTGDVEESPEELRSEPTSLFQDDSRLNQSTDIITSNDLTESTAPTKSTMLTESTVLTTSTATPEKTLKAETSTVSANLGINELDPINEKSPTIDSHTISVNTVLSESTMLTESTVPAPSSMLTASTSPTEIPVTKESTEISKRTVINTSMDINQSTELHISTMLTDSTIPLSESTEVPESRDLRESTMLTVSMVKGETSVPNTILDSLISVLETPVFIVYLRLFRLSYGFGKNTCTVGIDKLASVLNLGRATVTRSISKLEQLRLIQRIGANFGKGIKGNHYQVNLPNTINKESTMLTESTVIGKSTLIAQDMVTTVSNNKDHDHEDLKINDHDQRELMKIYTTLTGKQWSKADQRAYEQIRHLPVDHLAAEMRAISERSSAPIGSFQYFVTSIKNAVAEGKGIGQAAAARRRIEDWAAQLRQAHVGDGSYSISDLSADLKDRCAREGIEYTPELINEIISRR